MTSPGKAPALKGDWRCTKCGSVEEGLDTEQPLHCPDCGAPASALVFQSTADDEWEEIDEEDLENDDFDDDALYDDLDENENEMPDDDEEY